MNFGWAYPPGVTGNEPQIAGYPEGEAPHVCDSSECEHEDEAWPFYVSGGVRLYDNCVLCGAEQMEVWPDDDPSWDDDTPEDYYDD